MGRGDESQNKITEAASRLFATKGYQGTSIADIAAAAEFSEGAIYRHFASKEELLIACVRPVLEDSLEVLQKELPPADDLRSFVRLRMEKRFEHFNNHYYAYKILFSEAYFQPYLFKVLSEPVFNNEKISEGAEQLLSFGEILRLRNYLTFTLSQAFALWGIFHLRCIAGELKGELPEALCQISDQDLIDDMTDFFLYGVAGIPPETPGNNNKG